MASEAATTASDDHGAGGEFVFQWERRARSRWRLAGMLAAALLVHAVSFYVLQVAYTPTGTQLPPPAQVVLVPLDQPENAPLARWLTMNDPALTTRPAIPVASQVLAAVGFHYRPSYNAALPPFKSLEIADAALNTTPPRATLPGPVPVPLPVVAPTPNTAATGQTTRVVLAGPVETPAGAPLPPVRFTTVEGANVMNPSVFLVGVRSEGGEPFFFRQATSGNAAADEFARGYLINLALRAVPSTEGGTAWGTATFYWGNDAYR